MMPPTETPAQPPTETDDRFPSGPWTGFFLQQNRSGRLPMDLSLTFREGRVHGTGHDSVGSFRVSGQYSVEDGRCRWTKTYVGQHSLTYQGYNEGQGIWGNWSMTADWRGGFRVWPVAMGDPTQPRRSEQIDEPTDPVVRFTSVDDGELVEVGAPSGSAFGEPLGEPFVP